MDYELRAANKGLSSGWVSLSHFDEGDVVEVRDLANALVARGMVLSAAATLRGIIGKRTSDLPSDVAHEVIHRDDLVLLT